MGCEQSRGKRYKYLLWFFPPSLGLLESFSYPLPLPFGYLGGRLFIHAFICLLALEQDLTMWLWLGWNLQYIPVDPELRDPSVSVYTTLGPLFVSVIKTCLV